MHTTVHPSRWCITRKDLDDFEHQVRELYEAGGIPPDPQFADRYHNDPSIGPSMYRVNECFIKPQTLEVGTSWALMRHPEGLPCDVFVTHSWSEGVFEVITKVREAWPWDARHLYICFLSNPQNGNISAILGENPMQSPFAQALCSAKYFLVIPNTRQSLYSRLWCVFEAHLALERGLIIRMPCKPNLRNSLLVLAPHCLLFLACFVLLVFLGDSGVNVTFEKGLHIIGIAIALGIRALTQRFPRGFSWAMLAMLGMISGMSAHVIFACRDDHHEIPVMLRVPVVDTGFVILVLTCDSLQQIFDRVLAKSVEREGYQMRFDTVRHATASNPLDEQRIRAAIRGKEHEIDQSIQVLKAVGRYDKAVRSNMRLGMSLKGVRTGFQSCLAVGALYTWLLPFCAPLHWEGPDRLDPGALRETLFAAFTLLLVVLGICLELAGKGFYKDFAALVCQVLFVFGLGRHIIIGVLTMLMVAASDPMQSVQDGGWLNVTIYACCAAGAAAAVAISYCRRDAAASATCASAEVDAMRRFPSMDSGGSGESESSTCKPGDAESGMRNGQDDDGLSTSSASSRDGE